MIWQPIETAPKDGRGILVAKGFSIYVVNWDPFYEWWYVCSNIILRANTPTHWMPLPEPPISTTPEAT